MQIEFAQIEFFINTYSCIYYSIYSDILHLYAYASLFPQRSSAQIKYVSKRDKARTVSFQEKSLSTKFFEKKEKKEGKEQLNLYLETKHPDHVEASIKSESGMKGQKKLVAKKKKKVVSSTTLSRFFIHPSKRSLFDDTIYYSHPIFSSPSCSQIRRKFVATTGFIAFRARFWSICSTFRIVSRILLRCVNYRDNWSGGW